MKKRQDNPVGYRPSEEMKKIFERFCSGPASISRGQLIEVAMQFLNYQGEEKMKDIVTKFLLNEFEPQTPSKKGESKKTA